MNENLCYLTIVEASKLLKRRQLSPVELTQAFLRRIEELDSRLVAFTKVLPDQAMAEAKAAEEAILKGDYAGPLHGIPIALKDLYWTKGVPTTANSRILQDWAPSEDGTVVERLKEAGSVMLGKLNMSEFATLSPDDTSLFPPTRNPWDLNRVPGGSSSGSGAGVAAGMFMGSLGSDTGGSIRGPATLCGIVGLKPTYGRVSRHGVVPLSWTMDHCGPMTWTVEDTAIMLQAIAGYDPRDATSSREPVPDYVAALDGGVKDVRIGVPRGYIESLSGEMDPEVMPIVDNALGLLEGMGARVVDITIPFIDYVRPTGAAIWLSEGYAYHRRNLISRPEDYGRVARTLFRMGGLFSAGDYVQAQRMRSRIKREVEEIHGQVDLMVSPTFPAPAATFEGSDPLARISRGINFTSLFNLTGEPSISIPAGFSSAGLPVGMQISGRAFDEPTVLRVAHAYEQQAGWFEKRPPI